MDAISLGNVHTAFMYDNHSPSDRCTRRRFLTLDMIVSGGECYRIGVPSQGRFDAWDLPLDVAMAKSKTLREELRCRWGWTTMVWIDQTEKGKKLALELYHADDPIAQSSDALALRGFVPSPRLPIQWWQ